MQVGMQEEKQPMWARGYKKVHAQLSLSMKFFLPINIRMPSIVAIVVF